MPRSLREASSEFPGGIRQALRAHIGNQIPVVFLQGFCGDLRPPSIGRWPRSGTWRSRVLNLVSIALNGPAFVGFTVRDYTKWMNSIARCAESGSDQAAHTSPMVTKLWMRRTSIPLSSLGLSGMTDEVEHFILFQLDEVLTIVGISAEVCWKYRQLLEGVLQVRRFGHWVRGYGVWLLTDGSYVVRRRV